MAFSIIAAFMSITIGLNANSRVYPHEMRKATGFSIEAPLIHYVKGADPQVTIYGFIDKFSASEFERIVGLDQSIKEIIVDSQGGDIESSMRIAKIIKDRKMNLIVDGRCLSSCANFLFTAAEKKEVMPMSIIGIHDFSYRINNPQGEQWVSGNEIEAAVKKTNNQIEIDAYLKKNHLLKKFNAEVHIETFLFDDFNNFVTRRKKAFDVEDIKAQTSTAACPSIHFWILNQEQLESIGVSGIQKFWFPKTEIEIRNVLKENGFKEPNNFYFGSSQELKKLCLRSERSWIYDIWKNLINFLN